ncbi:MAG: threonine-phosphate decarboxylase CobD [Minwuia sp.]|uniref:threonine-phosphate decarboxylase CobD n=1 Tax=Minwuia sp. TaxID=2493630 RepID=UPI003A8B3A75
MTERVHGGNLTEAIARHGGVAADWLDLSTGINPAPYPVGDISHDAWTRLPDRTALHRLLGAARNAYGIHPANGIVAAAGAQALIQIMPRLAGSGPVRVLGPTYNEHAGCFRDAGFAVTVAGGFVSMPGGGTAVLVNPNNPDGRTHEPGDLLALARRSGLLVVDEAFCDVTPALSLCPRELPQNLVVLRSFGKFFGLAGVRLGFAVAHPAMARRIERMLGPWAVSGPAQEIGARALSDDDWIAATRERLSADMARLRRLLGQAGWRIAGGTDLFVTAEAGNIAERFDRLLDARIWVRSFDYAPDHLRFGLPGDESGWARLETALTS